MTSRVKVFAVEDENRERVGRDTEGVNTVVQLTCQQEK